ncbi:MAG: DDE-type integrase/transposase/recombinase [Bacteroidales bacterium]
MCTTWHKIYLSPIMDLHNGEIRSYTLSQSRDFEMVTSMLSKAIKRVKIKNDLIIHFDQKWHYQYKAYQGILHKKKIEYVQKRKLLG